MRCCTQTPVSTEEKLYFLNCIGYLIAIVPIIFDKLSMDLCNVSVDQHRMIELQFTKPKIHNYILTSIRIQIVTIPYYI